MAVTKDKKIVDLDTVLEGLDSLRDILLQKGLKTKEELLWLKQEEIDTMCEENNIPLFEKKRLEMSILAIEALSRTVERTPSPNGSVVVHHQSSNHKSKKHKHMRVDSNYSTYSNYSTGTTKGGNGNHDNNIYTDDGSNHINNTHTHTHTSRNRQPTIVRIVFSEAEEQKLNELDDKLMSIKDKIDQICVNMSSISWEKDRLERKIDAQFDEFVMHLQQRRQELKMELSDIASRQTNTMKKFIQTLNKQTKQIKEAQKKCEKHLSNTKLNKNQRRSKVMKAANKALDNKSDEKIIVPEIINRKKKDNKKKKKEPRNYFVGMELDEHQIKRFIACIGEIRRVLVPFPPKFEIFTIESNRIKLKVWDQTHSNNKMAKKEKTEFMARIAEQIQRNSVSEEDTFDNIGLNDHENENESNKQIIEEGMDKMDENNNNNNAPDIVITPDEKKEATHENENENNANELNNENDNDNNEIEEEQEQINIMDDINVNNNNEMNEEYKYDKRERKENINNDVQVYDHDHDQRMKSRKREHRRDKKKKRDKNSKKGKIDWEKYPVFKPHDINNRKVISSKYTVWIDNLKPNTTYLLKLRGYNKYGNGDWTKVYSFVTKLTSFEFKSSVIKQSTIKNAVFEILCKKLSYYNQKQKQASHHHHHSNDTQQFALKRIFSTETHGFSSKKFHEICDNKAKTLLIAESEYGSIFGAYSDASWSINTDKSDKWKNDPNAFLFLLRNSKKQHVSLVFDCIDQYNATRSNINSGPCFGQGFDLYICDNCNKFDNSYSEPKSFNIPQNVCIGGRKKFKIKNYDVYMVVV